MNINDYEPKSHASPDIGSRGFMATAFFTLSAMGGVFTTGIGIGLRASGNLPVSYVLTGKLPVTYRKFITLFIFLSFRSI